VHALPHELQLFASLVVSTQLPLQAVGAADGQLEAHAYEPPEPAQTFDPEHAFPQLPQFRGVVNWTQAPLQTL
jgi:hypothetical protein